MGRFRLLGSAVGCWALVVMPALCTGGFLVHACECSQAYEAGCGHEAECATHPCGKALTRPNGVHDGSVGSPLLGVAPPAVLNPATPRVLPPVAWSFPSYSAFGTGVLDALGAIVLLI